MTIKLDLHSGLEEMTVESSNYRLVSRTEIYLTRQAFNSIKTLMDAVEAGRVDRGATLEELGVRFIDIRNVLSLVSAIYALEEYTEDG